MSRKASKTPIRTPMRSQIGAVSTEEFNKTFTGIIRSMREQYPQNPTQDLAPMLVFVFRHGNGEQTQSQFFPPDEHWCQRDLRRAGMGMLGRSLAKQRDMGSLVEAFAVSEVKREAHGYARDLTIVGLTTDGRLNFALLPVERSAGGTQVAGEPSVLVQWLDSPPNDGGPSLSSPQLMEIDPSVSVILDALTVLVESYVESLGGLQRANRTAPRMAGSKGRLQ